MSYPTVQVLHVPTPATPRGALLVGSIANLLASAFGRRARRVISRGEQAAALRGLARSVEHSDPGLCADLMGAAARHESLDDE